MPDEPLVPPRDRIRRVLEPPFPLPPEARAMWDRTAPRLERAGRLTEDDLESFGALCMAWGLVVDAASTLHRDGMTAPGTGNDRETVKKHPAFQEWRDSMSTFTSLADRFGLNPKARGAMHSPAPLPEAGSEELLD